MALAAIVAASVYGAPLRHEEQAGTTIASTSMGGEMSMEDQPYMGPDLGAEYAATMPLVGVDLSWSFAGAVKGTIPKAACAPLVAAIKRHNHWFDGADAPVMVTARDGGSAASNQQDAERAFMASIGTKLCAKPMQSDDEYMTILHGMLSEVRTHINRHVHSAFFVKLECAFLEQYANCYDGDARAKMAPHDAYISPMGSFNQTEGCFTAILNHEKYNLAEGFTFVNISYSLVMAGAAFCTDPAYSATVAMWTSSLDEAMAYHRSNHAFDEMLDAHLEQVCTEDDAYEGQYDHVYNTVAEQIDADVLSVEQDCSLSPEAFDRAKFLRSNPPDADDMVTIIEQNTRLTIATAATAAFSVTNKTGSCVDPATGAADMATAAAILAKVKALQVYSACTSKEGAEPCWAVDGRMLNLALPTVYHKVMMACDPTSLLAGDDVMYSMCRGTRDMEYVDIGKPGYGIGSVSDSNPVYDLVTAADITKCRGDACKAAAKAVLAYQELLGTVTVMRTDVTHVTTGATAAQPFWMQDDWIFQRSCTALMALADNAAMVEAKLPTVIADLRAATPQLEVSCVSPAREHLSDAATAVLGAPKAKANAALWDKMGDVAIDGCKGDDEGEPMAAPMPPQK